MTHYKIKSDLEYRWIWNFSIFSTILGVSLAIWMGVSQSETPISLLGFAHAVVFIPAMIIARTKLWKIIGLSLVCITFPIWGYTLVSLLTGGIGSPVSNSLIWGVVVAFALKQTKAIFAFFIIGVISNALLLWLMSLGNLYAMSNMEAGFAETIGLWYLLVLPVFPMLIRAVHTASNKVPRNTCFYCGYSLIGLLSDTSCPECGKNRPPVGFE